MVKTKPVEKTLQTKRYSRQIYGVFHACGLTTNMAGCFIDGIARIEENRGLKAVVSAMKEHWYAIVSGTGCRRHSDGSFFGFWRPIYRLSCKGRRGKSRALRILKLYGYFKHPEPVRKDYWEKAVSLSQTPEPRQPIVVPPTVNFTRYNPGRRMLKPFPYPLSTKKCPLNAEGDQLPEVFVSPSEHIQSLDMFPNFVVTFFDEVMSIVGDKHMPNIEHFRGIMNTDDVGGRVSLLTKDRGYKLRLVANTNRMLQVCIDPLKQYLHDYMDYHPNCYVFDQDGGADWVIRSFQAGKTLTCLDLKSATDNIPLEPQLRLILDLELSLKPQVDMYRHIARMKWLTPYEFRIQWKRGHPMGAGPSFGIFTVWLLHILEYSGLGYNQFAVVGDDLVFESSAEDSVLGILEVYGIPLSEGKCLFSNRINAEFVGRVLDKYGEVRNLKASLPDKNKPMGIVRQYGLRALRFLLPRPLRTQYIRDMVQIVLEYESNEAFREGVLYLANAKQRAKLLKQRPEELYAGGLSWTIMNKMSVDCTDPRVKSYIAAKVFETGQLYSLYKDCFVTVQALEVSYNPPSHREHRKMLLEDFEELDSDEAIAERLEMIRLNPGTLVVDVEQSEQDAKSGQFDPADSDEYKRFDDPSWKQVRQKSSLLEDILVTGTILMLFLYAISQ